MKIPLKADLRDRREESQNRQLIITSRDLIALGVFRAVRFIETSQLATVLVPGVFPTEEKLRRRLRKLVREHYLDRPARRIAALRKFDHALIGERNQRGRPEDVWALAQKGADVLALKGDWNKNNGRLR